MWGTTWAVIHSHILARRQLFMCGPHIVQREFTDFDVAQ